MPIINQMVAMHLAGGDQIDLKRPTVNAEYMTGRRQDDQRQVRRTAASFREQHRRNDANYVPPGTPRGGRLAAKRDRLDKGYELVPLESIGNATRDQRRMHQRISMMLYGRGGPVRYIRGKPVQVQPNWGNLTTTKNVNLVQEALKSGMLKKVWK